MQVPNMFLQQQQPKKKKKPSFDQVIAEIPAQDVQLREILCSEYK